VVAGTRRIEGVTHVEADAVAHRLVVRYDPHLTTEAKVIAAVEKVVERVAQ